MQLQLHLIEHTLNALARCNRKRSGTFIEHQKEEADVQRAAFEEAKGNCATDLRAAINAGDRARDEMARLREAPTDVLLAAERRDEDITRIATSALSIDYQ